MDIQHFIAEGAIALWSVLLTAWLAYMAYNAQKRDTAIATNAAAHSALELKMAENYATKVTVMQLFQEATGQNKDAISRVEKRIDETNSALAKQTDKIDKVLESVNNLQTNVLHELAKKT